jgi:hypothetical protein
MIDLYSGGVSDDWFLGRLLSLFSLLLDDSAVISFLSSINEKIERPLPDWIHAILSRHAALVPFEVGVELIIDTVTRHREDRFVSDPVRDTLSLFETRTDENYLFLFENLVRNFRARDDLMGKLYPFQWLRAPSLMRYFAMALRYLSWERMRRAVDPLVNDPLPFLRDGGYADVLQYVAEERELIMDYLVSSVEFFCTAPDAGVMLRTVVSLASFAQQDVLLEKFEALLGDAGLAGLRKDVADDFDRFLITVSTKAGLAFLRRNQEPLTLLPNARFMQSYAYMEFRLNQKDAA